MIRPVATFLQRLPDPITSLITFAGGTKAFKIHIVYITSLTNNLRSESTKWTKAPPGEEADKGNIVLSIRNTIGVRGTETLMFQPRFLGMFDLGPPNKDVESLSLSGEREISPLNENAMGDD